MMASVYQQIIHFEYSFATEFSIYANAALILLFIFSTERKTAV